MKKAKKILIGIGLTALIAIFLMIVVYYFMYVDTNSVFNYAKDVFLGKVPHEEVEDTPLSTYDVTERDDIVTVDLEISRAFVIHNFTDGYIFVKYDCRGYDENGEFSYGAATGTFPHWDRWTIHKENGEWEIIDIFEPHGNLTMFDD